MYEIKQISLSVLNYTFTFALRCKAESAEVRRPPQNQKTATTTTNLHFPSLHEK